MELVFYAVGGGLWGIAIYWFLIDPWFEKREIRRIKWIRK